MIDLFIVPEEGKVVYDFHLGNWPEEKKRFSLWESDSVALADRLVPLSHDPRKIIQMFLARKDIRRTHYASGRLGTRKPPRWWSAGFTLSAKEFKLDRNTLSREISLLITIMASIGRRCRASIAHFSALLLSRGSLSVFLSCCDGTVKIPQRKPEICARSEPSRAESFPRSFYPRVSRRKFRAKSRVYRHKSPVSLLLTLSNFSSSRARPKPR